MTVGKLIGWAGVDLDDGSLVSKLRKAILDHQDETLTPDSLANYSGLPRDKVSVMLASEANGARVQRVAVGEYRYQPDASPNGNGAAVKKATKATKATRKTAPKRQRSGASARTRTAVVERVPIPKAVIVLNVLAEHDGGLLCSGDGRLFLAKPVDVVPT